LIKKKRSIFILFIATVLVIIVYFVLLTNLFISSSHMDYLESKSTIVMYTNLSAESENILNFTLVNNTDSLYVYGTSFLLYKRVNRIWRLIPIRRETDEGHLILFSLVGHHLQPNSYSVGSIDLSFLFESLDIGEYRIIKELFQPNAPEIKERIVGRFTIPGTTGYN